jgi:hypothetical protein
MVRFFSRFSTPKNVDVVCWHSRTNFAEFQLKILLWRTRERRAKRILWQCSNEQTKRLTTYFAVLFFFSTFSCLSLRSYFSVIIYRSNCVVKEILKEQHNSFFSFSFSTLHQLAVKTSSFFYDNKEEQYVISIFPLIMYAIGIVV